MMRKQVFVVLVSLVLVSSVGTVAARETQTAAEQRENARLSGKSSAAALHNAFLGHRFAAIFNDNNAAIIDRIFAPTFVARVSGSPTPTLTREGFKAYLKSFRTSFPDIDMRVHDVVTTDDTLILRVTIHGTHKGDFQGLPASNRRVAFDGIAYHRMKDGKIVEHWGVMDLVSLMQQLTAEQ